MPDIRINGTRLAYAERGRGEPVILVHGGSGDLRTWDRQQDVFGERFRAIAVSARGYWPGEPLPPGGTFTLDMFVDDMAAFIRALDLAPVHYVGHSSPGAFGGLLLARRHPGLLRSLVVAEPPAFPLLGVSLPPKPPQLLRLFVRHPQVAIAFVRFGARGIRPALAAFARGDDAGGLRAFMKANLGPDAFARVPPERIERGLANIVPLKAQIRAGFPAFREDDARAVRAPTLLVSGERSNAVLRGVTDALHRLLPDAERLDIAGASHDMFESHPDAFSRGVLEFLEKHREAPDDANTPVRTATLERAR